MKNPLVSFQKLYLISLSIFFVTVAKSQLPTFSWSRAIYGDSTESCKIRTDSRGSVYVGGTFNSNTILFENTSISNSGWNDIFLSKYDSSGQLIWVKKYGSTGQDLLSAITTDKNGDILIAGSFENSISFDGITLTSNGDKDAFYAKISKAGNVLWAKSAGGNSRDAANDISTDNAGNTYICGDFSSNNFLFAGRLFNLYDSISTNLFYAKLNTNGDTAWVKTPTISSGSGNSLTKIKPTFSGNILLYGSASDISAGRLSFGSTNFANPLNGSISVYGMFTVEVNQLGNTISEGTLPINRFQGNAIHCRKNIFYSGRAGHTMQFPEGVITKLNAPTTPYSMGSSSILAGPPFTSSNVLEIAEDNYQKIYFTGHYAINGAFKAYLVSLDTSLNLINDTSINTTNNISTFCESIAIDTITNVAYVAGTYLAPSSFTLGSNNVLASTGNSYDGYLMKVILPKYDTLLVNAGNDTAICAGQAAILGSTQTAKGNGAPFSYAWSPAVGLSNATSSNPVALPLSTTLFTVTVTNSYGYSKKDSILIQVLPLPTPTITANGNTTFCVGNSVGLTTTASPNYLWSNGNTSQTIVANISGNYTVKVTDVNGCSSTSAPINIVVNQLPAIPTITANGNTNFCAGNSVGLTTTASSTYLWSNGNTSQSIVANISGNYTVKVTDANGCSSTSAPINIIVNPLPATPTITANGITTFCAGNSVGLTTATSPNYLWSDGNTSQTIVANISGNYTVKVTDVNGCSSTSAPINIIVNPLPAIPTITANGNTTFCAGNSVGLTTANSLNYLWSNGNTSQNIVVNVSGNYTVKVTDVNGCSSTSAPINIVVNQLPAIPTITANGNTTFCAGNSVGLTTTASPNYLWSNGNTSQSIVANISGNYTVKVTDANGCSSTSAPINIMVNPLPAIPTITANGNTTFCGGDSIKLSSSDYTNYLWNRDSTNQQTITIYNSGTFKVTHQNNFGCRSTSLPINITVNPLPPLPIITQAGNVLTVNTVTGIQWFLNNNSILGETNPMIQIANGGSYKTKVTNNFGCTTSSENFVAIYFRNFVTGPKVFFHQVYPNPAVTDINISYGLQLSKKVSISIVDITGKLIVVPLKNRQQSAGIHTVSITNVGQTIGHGLYFVRYEINNVTVVDPILIK